MLVVRGAGVLPFECGFGAGVSLNATMLIALAVVTELRAIGEGSMKSQP